MIATLVAVIGLALLDSINPSALAVTLYLLSGKSYITRVLVYIAAVFVTYFVTGLLLLLGLEGVRQYLESPVAYGIQGIIGAMMLVASFVIPVKPKANNSSRVSQARGLSGLFLLGVTVTVLEFPTAIPYIGAVGILTSANLPVTHTRFG